MKHVSILFLSVCVLASCERDADSPGSSAQSALATPPGAPSASESPAPPAAATPPTAPAPRERASLVELAEKQREIDVTYGEALAALRRGDRKAARAYFGEVLAESPKHRAAAIALGRIHREDGAYDDSLAILDGTLERIPGDLTLLLERARTLFALGENGEALATIDRTLEKGDEFPAARFLRAVVLASEGEPDAAVTALADAIDNGFSSVDQIRSERHFQKLADVPMFQKLVAGLESRSPSSAAEFLESISELPETEGPIEIITDPLPLLRELEKGWDAREPAGLAVESLRGADGAPLAPKKETPVILTVWDEKTPGFEQIVRRAAAARDRLAPHGIVAAGLCVAADQEVTSQARGEVVSFHRMQKLGLDLRFAAVERDTLLAIGVSGLPATVLVGADGKVRLAAVGYPSEDVLYQLGRAVGLGGPIPVLPGDDGTR